MFFNGTQCMFVSDDYEYTISMAEKCELMHKELCRHLTVLPVKSNAIMKKINEESNNRKGYPYQ